MKRIIDIPEETYEYEAIKNSVPFPEREKGTWIITYPNGKYNPIYECPKCKASNNSVFKNFCPNCGADLRGKDNETK